MNIAFYGQVLDQSDGYPELGAKVTVSWTDLSAKGVSLREIITDDDGNVALTDVKGKHLFVRSIEKAGFKYGVQKRDDWEYAAFFAENYYAPDP